MLDFPLLMELLKPSAFLQYPNKDSKDRLLGHLDYNWTYLACSIYRMPASLCIRKVEAKGNSLERVILMIPTDCYAVTLVSYDMPQCEHRIHHPKVFASAAFLFCIARCNTHIWCEMDIPMADLMGSESRPLPPSHLHEIMLLCMGVLDVLKSPLPYQAQQDDPNT